MDYLNNLYGDYIQPLVGGSGSGSAGGSSGGMLGGLADLANKGLGFYKNLTGKSTTGNSGNASTATAANYMPFILAGGGALIVIVLLVLVLRRH